MRRRNPLLPLVLILSAVVCQPLVGATAEKIKQLDCRSKNFTLKRCSIDGTVRAIRLLEQKSESRCIGGESFGYAEDYVWVDKGCEAKFEVSYTTDKGSGWWRWLGGLGGGREKSHISCKSKGFTPAY